MDILLMSFAVVVQILVSYFFKNSIFELALSFLQNLNKPLDFIVSFLQGSQSSIIRLNYKQKLLNFLLVIIALIMIISEFGTLKEVISATLLEENIRPIIILKIPIRLEVLAAIAYISIATLLGFLSLELFGFRRVFQGIFYNEIYQKAIETRAASTGRVTIPDKIKYVIAFVFLGALLLLAYFQGELALLRYELTVESSGSSAIIDSHKSILGAFYFILGFLTPIIASFALLSFDIFISIIANFLILIIKVIQQVLSALYLAFEAVITLISSPLVKLLELFGIYQAENINYLNKGKAKPAVKVAPLTGSSDIYRQNKAQIYYKYNTQNKIILICDQPSISLSLPSIEQLINDTTTFKEIISFLQKKYYILREKKMKFQYTDQIGVIKEIDEAGLVINYFKIDSPIFIQVD